MRRCSSSLSRSSPAASLSRSSRLSPAASLSRSSRLSPAAADNDDEPSSPVVRDAVLRLLEAARADESQEAMALGSAESLLRDRTDGAALRNVVRAGYSKPSMASAREAIVRLVRAETRRYGGRDWAWN